MLKEETVDDLYKLTYENREANKESGLLGCVLCGLVFSPEEVTDGVLDIEDYTDNCPACGIDAVVSLGKILESLNENGFGDFGKEEFNIRLTDKIKEEL